MILKRYAQEKLYMPNGSRHNREAKGCYPLSQQWDTARLNYEPYSYRVRHKGPRLCSLSHCSCKVGSLDSQCIPSHIDHSSRLQSQACSDKIQVLNLQKKHRISALLKETHNLIFEVGIIVTLKLNSDHKISF